MERGVGCIKITGFIICWNGNIRLISWADAMAFLVDSQGGRSQPIGWRRKIWFQYFLLLKSCVIFWKPQIAGDTVKEEKWRILDSSSSSSSKYHISPSTEEFQEQLLANKLDGLFLNCILLYCMRFLKNKYTTRTHEGRIKCIPYKHQFASKSLMKPWGCCMFQCQV